MNCWRTVWLGCALFAATTASSAQTFTTLLSFNNANGSYPGAFLVQGTDGNLYGTTVGSDVIFKITTAGTLTTLYTFSGPDGRNPVGLTLGTDENFYGTTNEGGSSAACSNGCGTVFKITPGGVLTTLHSFDNTEGSFPSAVLVQGTDGNFYGTTAYGGTDNSCVEYGMSGCGTIFRITPAGAFTTLHSFHATDGWQPTSGLVEGTDGNFYGTTTLGGIVAGGAYKGGGTIFKISPKGALTTLYDFCSQTGCTDGQFPDASLIQATDGNFYGTAADGGNAYCYYGQQGGTVFRITSAGRMTTLHSFCFTEGRIPAAPLLQATDGNLYGTADAGGNGGDSWCTAGFDVGCGTIFKVAVDTGLTTLVHTFDWTDGSNPVAALIQGTTERSTEQPRKVVREMRPTLSVQYSGSLSARSRL